MIEADGEEWPAQPLKNAAATAHEKAASQRGEMFMRGVLGAMKTLASLTLGSGTAAPGCHSRAGAPACSSHCKRGRLQD